MLKKVVVLSSALLLQGCLATFSGDEPADDIQEMPRAQNSQESISTLNVYSDNRVAMRSSSNHGAVFRLGASVRSIEQHHIEWTEDPVKILGFQIYGYVYNAKDLKKIQYSYTSEREISSVVADFKDGRQIKGAWPVRKWEEKPSFVLCDTDKNCQAISSRDEGWVASAATDFLEKPIDPGNSSEPYRLLGAVSVFHDTRLVFLETAEAATLIQKAQALKAEWKLQRERFVAAREMRQKQEREKAAHEAEVARKELRKREMEYNEWRKTLKTGSPTFCGLVIERKDPLVKIAVNVQLQGYAAEQWLDLRTVYPEHLGCRHVNGKLQPLKNP